MNEEIKNTEEIQEESNSGQNGSEAVQESPAPDAEMSPQKEQTESCESSPAQAEADEWKDKYMRLVAEFDNYKKRTSRERIEMVQMANKDLMIALLDVVDDMDRAQEQLETDQDVASIKEGVQLVFNKLRKTLNDRGLRSYDSKGQDFDVELHEAITEVPASSEELKGKVMDQVQKGYYLNDKIIRHAKVVVGK